MARKPPVARTKASLLVEIGTEELPPASLRKLSQAFASQLGEALTNYKLAEHPCEWFATPRRLSVLAPQVALQQPDNIQEKRGPALSASFDANNHPTAAALGFAKACGVTVDKLQHLQTDAGAWLVFRSRQKGRLARNLIPECIELALSGLPVPKYMRWGSGSAEFVRPVHWLTVIHGKSVVPCKLFGIQSGRNSYGHRFLANKPIRISSPISYPKTLKEHGCVVVDFNERKKIIRKQIEALGRKAGGKAIIDENLLNTVTGLVEWPRTLLGTFEPSFLDMPSEVLVSSMRDHQKYFHIVDESSALLSKFITVTNIQNRRMQRVRSGNERVLRARLADAQFFWEEDCKQPIEGWIENLQAITFQGTLGSIHDKSCRIRFIAGLIAKKLGWKKEFALRAAELCKVDLASQMVGEFPELQGIMGYHYALQKSERKNVAIAIKEHYLPRHAGDELPSSRAGKILAIADRVDTLTGIFSTGEEPTGEKDPYGLRRAALGIIRILVEQKISLDLAYLVDLAVSAYASQDHFVSEQNKDRVIRFIMDRYRAYYSDANFSSDEISSVKQTGETNPVAFDRRIKAISRFRKTEAAASLVATNKRIRNILRRASGQAPLEIDNSLFEHDAEKYLAESLLEISAVVSPLVGRGDYLGALKQIAHLRGPVDSFFADVMVLVDDDRLRTNRLALLNQVANLFGVVADISKLQPANE
ncbi:MAG: glycine--tRNA ligase subunit beta [Acidiferrobacteraceae bacterium]|nr:glycine--tRNA ligase subunit beta [Acidiferrobacteraceae bacterium]